MSTHSVLWSLLIKLVKKDKCEAYYEEARMFDSIKIAFKSHFCHKQIIILSLCTQRSYGHHNVPGNLFINCISWRYFTNMRRLLWGFSGHTYHIVGNLMSRLNYLHGPHCPIFQ